MLTDGGKLKSISFFGLFSCLILAEVVVADDPLPVQPSVAYVSVVSADDFSPCNRPENKTSKHQICENSKVLPIQDNNQSANVNNKEPYPQLSSSIDLQNQVQTPELFPDAALQLGYHYLQQGNYRAAIVEFKRFLFFHPHSETVGAVYCLLSLAEAELEQWEPAIKHIRLAIQVTPTDSIAESYRITLASYHLAQRQYSSAELELTRLAQFSDYETIRDKARLLLVLCHIFQYKWQQAHLRLAEVADHLPPPLWAKLDSLLAVRSKNYKSPQKAKWLSTFLPGAGQYYSGDWRNGLGALAINAITSYVLYTAIIGKQIGDILIVYVTLFDRYYQGNRANAENAALNHNERVNRRLAKEILALFENHPLDFPSNP